MLIPFHCICHYNSTLNGSQNHFERTKFKDKKMNQASIGHLQPVVAVDAADCNSSCQNSARGNSLTKSDTAGVAA